MLGPRWNLDPTKSDEHMIHKSAKQVVRVCTIFLICRYWSVFQAPKGTTIGITDAASRLAMGIKIGPKCVLKPLFVALPFRLAKKVLLRGFFGLFVDPLSM